MRKTDIALAVYAVCNGKNWIPPVPYALRIHGEAA